MLMSDHPPRRQAGKSSEDDWVGEPPEGRITRDRSRPGYWQNQWQAVAARAVLPVLALIAIALILLLR
jgi:hypothetical protein